jgi:hypothetical protein
MNINGFNRIREMSLSLIRRSRKQDMQVRILSFFSSAPRLFMRSWEVLRFFSGSSAQDILGFPPILGHTTVSSKGGAIGNTGPGVKAVAQQSESIHIAVLALSKKR